MVSHLIVSHFLENIFPKRNHIFHIIIFHNKMYYFPPFLIFFSRKIWSYGGDCIFGGIKTQIKKVLFLSILLHPYILDGAPQLKWVPNGLKKFWVVLDFFMKNSNSNSSLTIIIYYFQKCWNFQKNIFLQIINIFWRKIMNRQRYFYLWKWKFSKLIN
jgi:hypothetical protein